MIDGQAVRIHENAGDPPASASTFVLVHGVGMSHRYLAPLHDALAITDRVISIDLPGFGGLPKPSTDLTVEEMGGVLARTVEALDIDDVVLVGHSMGVQWVLEAAADVPDRVRRVVLIGPVVDARFRTLIAQARALAVDTLGESAAVNAIVFGDYLRCGPRWYLRQARRMLEYPTEKRVRELLMPVLLIRGGDDPVAGPEWCRALLSAARDGDLVEVRKQQHNVQYSAPRGVADAILAGSARAHRRPSSAR